MNLIGLRAFKIKFLVAMGLLLSSVILLIVLSPNDQRETVGNITNPIAINIAVILSIIILVKQKLDGDLGRAFLSLFIGLILWGTAEVLFSYDEIVTNDIGNITISDFLWLMGYGPLIYFGTKMYTLFHSFSSRKSIILVSVIMVAYIIYLLPFMISTYNESQLEDLPLLYVRLSYVILDLIFIYPAALVILNSEILKGKLGNLLFFALDVFFNDSYRNSRQCFCLYVSFRE